MALAHTIIRFFVLVSVSVGSMTSGDLARQSDAGKQLVAGQPAPVPVQSPTVVVRPARTEPVVVVGPPADRPLQALGEWAIERFEDAGMSLPPVDMHLHRDATRCGGHRGTFSPTLARIDVCTDDRLTVLHELAHAWAHEHLDEATRDAYVAAQGLESWHDPQTDWGARGSEHAADVVAWALLEGPIAMPLPDGPITEANDAFRSLTGFDAPRLVWTGDTDS